MASKQNPLTTVLRVIDFNKIWASQILSQFALNFINFVIVLRIFETTHSIVAVSLVWVFYAIPALLLGPFAGTIVDLVEKKKILFWTLVGEAIVVLLYLLVKQKVWPIYSAIFLYSLINQLYIPAEGSTLATVVPKKLYASANTLFIFTMYSAFLLGYGVAGTVVRVVGRDIPFVIGASLLALAALAVSFLPAGLRTKQEEIDGFPEFWKKVTEGYDFIKKNKTVLYPLGLLVLANILVGIFAILAPLLATELLMIDLLDIGWAIILPTGLGAVLGALWVVMTLRHSRKKRVINFGLFLLTAAILTMDLIVPRMTGFKIPLAMFMTFLLGVGIVSLFIPSQTMLQEKTPEEFRGRVFGVLGFLFTLASVLPIIFTAAIADVLGITTVILMLAFIMLIIAIYSLKEPYGKYATEINR